MDYDSDDTLMLAIDRTVSSYSSVHPSSSAWHDNVVTVNERGGNDTVKGRVGRQCKGEGWELDCKREGQSGGLRQRAQGVRVGCHPAEEGVVVRAAQVQGPRHGALRPTTLSCYCTYATKQS